VFLGDDFCPIPDQWSFLSLAKRLSIEKIHGVVREAERAGNLIGVRLSACDEEGSDPWLMPPSQKKKPEVIPGPLPERVTVTLGNLVYVPKDGLSSAMLNQLLRSAAFQNPEFYRAQAMRLSTFGKPRVIHCAEEFSRHLGLPRGCQSEVIGLLESHGIQVDLADERFHHGAIALEGVDGAVQITGGEIALHFFQLVQQQLEPEFVDLVHDDEQHLVVLARAGALRPEEGNLSLAPGDCHAPFWANGRRNVKHSVARQAQLLCCGCGHRNQNFHFNAARPLCRLCSRPPQRIRPRLGVHSVRTSPHGQPLYEISAATRSRMQRA
jgi:hypothetical protein